MGRRLTDGDSAQGSFQFGVGNVTIPASAPAMPAAPEQGNLSNTKSQIPVIWIAGSLVLLIIILVGWLVLRKRSQA